MRYVRGRKTPWSEQVVFRPPYDPPPFRNAAKGETLWKPRRGSRGLCPKISKVLNTTQKSNFFSHGKRTEKVLLSGTLFYFSSYLYEGGLL